MIGQPGTRCCICKGKYGDEDIQERIYVEPTGGEDVSPKYIRGWMCIECTVCHWAWSVEDKAE